VDGDESLSEVFWSVARMLRHRDLETVEPFGITLSQSRALGVLQRHGAMRLSDLAHHLRIAPRSATEVVDALEQRHLLSRSPDPSDRRATLVEVTPDGESISRAVRKARLAEGDELFTVLSADQREVLAGLLQTVRAAADPRHPAP